MSYILCLRTLCWVTVSIRIVADFGLQNCQITRELKRVTTLEFTTITAIIFIHCYALLFIIYKLHYLFQIVYLKLITFYNISRKPL